MTNGKGRALRLTQALSMDSAWNTATGDVIGAHPALRTGAELASSVMQSQLSKRAPEENTASDMQDAYRQAPWMRLAPVEHTLPVAVVQGIQQLLQDLAGLCLLQAGQGGG